MKKIIIAVIAIASIAGMAIYAQKNEKVTIDDERFNQIGVSCRTRRHCCHAQADRVL